MNLVQKNNFIFMSEYSTPNGQHFIHNYLSRHGVKSLCKTIFYEWDATPQGFKRRTFYTPANTANSLYLSYFHMNGTPKDKGIKDKAVGNVNNLLFNSTLNSRNYPKQYFYSVLISGQDGYPFGLKSNDKHRHNFLYALYKNFSYDMKYTDKGNGNDIYEEYSKLRTKIYQQIRENKSLSHVIALASDIENPWHLKKNNAYKKAVSLTTKFMNYKHQLLKGHQIYDIKKINNLLKPLRIQYHKNLKRILKSVRPSDIYSHPHVHMLISTSLPTEYSRLASVIKKDFRKLFGYKPTEATVRPLKANVPQYDEDNNFTGMQEENVTYPAVDHNQKPQWVVDSFIRYIFTDYHLQTKDCGYSREYELRADDINNSIGRGFYLFKFLPLQIRHIIVCSQLNSTKGKRLQRYYKPTQNSAGRKELTFDTFALPLRVLSNPLCYFNTTDDYLKVHSGDASHIRFLQGISPAPYPSTDKKHSFGTTYTVGNNDITILIYQINTYDNKLRCTMEKEKELSLFNSS